MYLLIDTTEFSRVKLVLWQGSRIKSIEKQVNRNLSEQLIFILEAFLKKNKTKLSGLSGIAVKVGKGSFTGIRTGVATANAVGFALRIPVISAKTQQNLDKIKFPKNWSLLAQAAPTYAKPPNITKPRGHAV